MNIINRVKFGLKLKFTLFVILIVITMLLEGWYSLEKSKVILQQELEKRGTTLTENLAYNSRYGVAIEDTFILNELIDGVINDEDVVYVIISDLNGNVLTVKDKRDRDIIYPDFLRKKALKINTPTITQYFSDKEQNILYDIAVPVESRMQKKSYDSLNFLYELPGVTEEATTGDNRQEISRRGVVQVGITLKNIDKKIKELEKITLYFILAVIIIGITVIFVFTKIMIVPLENMAVKADKIAEGDFEQRVDIPNSDEIGQLASAFNKMTVSLQERNKEIRNSQEKLTYMNIELKNLNINLENRVKGRTKELKDAYKELQDTHVQLIQSAKMASLGQLVAGIAHEINNPLNFIYGNIKFFRKGYEEIKKITDRYEQISKKDNGVHIAIMRVKEETEFDSILEDLNRKINNCVIGVERMRDIIQNLRRFSRFDAADLKMSSIHAGLDSTLALLGHELKDRVKIVREYGDVPDVKCYPGKLNQLFMNILANALQAINGPGKIRIRTFIRNEMVVIEIDDTGSGIPDDIIGQIFDPFFTTKEPGKGTGLGLSISYKIIEGHKGRLYAVNIPGKGARFTTEIPIGDNC